MHVFWGVLHVAVDNDIQCIAKMVRHRIIDATSVRALPLWKPYSTQLEGPIE